jgi:hypothetical protein
MHFQLIFVRFNNRLISFRIFLKKMIFTNLPLESLLCLFFCSTSVAFNSPARLPFGGNLKMSCSDGKSTGYKILALHGKGENGDAFRARLAKLVDMTPQVSWEFITAPHSIGEEGEFAWWTLPPRVRSFEATEYTGIQETFEARSSENRKIDMPN